jgi:hypothetical protein
VNISGASSLHLYGLTVTPAWRTHEGKPGSGLQGQRRDAVHLLAIWDVVIVLTPW